MKTALKRTLSVLLALLMAFSCAAVAFAEPQVETTDSESDIGIAAGQGMGTLLNGLVEAQEDAQAQPCYISSMTVADKTATAQLTAEKDCTFVAAVYDETTKQMLGCGTASVAAGQSEATVTLQVLSMPSTYLLKGFLLDETHAAIGKCFVSMEYTKAYQEFLETTPEDFDSEDTIYFDPDAKEENFAVLTDDVTAGTVDESMTWTYAEETGTYTFRNATAQVKALNVGDVFYYEFGDSGSEFLLFKVKTVSVSGSTVTVVEDENLSLQEAFQFVRLEHGINEGSDFIDESRLPEALQPDASVQGQAEIINDSGKVSLSDSLKLEYKNDRGFGISGAVGVEFSAAAKLYYDMRWGKDYYEFSLTFSFKFSFSVSITGKLDMVDKDKVYIPMADIPIGPFVLEGKVFPILSFSAKLDVFKVEYTSKFDLYVSSESGGPQANTSSDKKWETDFGDAKIEIKIGAGIEFGVSLLKVLEAGFDVSAGLRIDANPDIVGLHGEIHHDCTVCFVCEAHPFAEGSIFLKIKLFTDKLSLRWDAIKLSFDFNETTANFYLSISSRGLKIGFGTCPYKLIAVKFKVVDEAGNPISNAALSSATGVCDINGDGVFEANEIKTPDSGIASIWFTRGKHTVTVHANNYKSKSTAVEVAEIGKIVTIKLLSGGSEVVTPPGGDTDFDGDITQCKVGDIIQYGSYPQTRVTDNDTLLRLEAAAMSKDWTAYPYYIKSEQTEYMYYLDVKLGTQTYRGVRFDRYRPYFTDNSSSENKSGQDNNGYKPNVVYWFRYEPLQWRVLDPATGLVLCETIIDSQNFHHTDAKHPNGKYASNWGESDIRTFLNTTFMNTAFNGAEQQAILSTDLDTPCPGDSTYNAGKTTDKVFLLSYDDVINPAYGFSDRVARCDTARRAQGSDYAKCQGLWVSTGSSYSGNSMWYLRSPADPYRTFCVNTDGSADDYCYIDYTSYGVRPALRLNLGSVISQSEIGSVHSAGETGERRTVSAGQTYTASQSSVVPGEEYVLLVRAADADALTADTLWYIDQKTADSAEIGFAYVPSHSGECTVEIIGRRAAPVEPEPQSRLTGVTCSGGTLVYKKSMTLAPTVQTDGDVQYTLTYSSSNPKIAEVDRNGSITTRKSGTVTVTVTATNNADPADTVETTCTVTVKYAWWQWIIRILLLGFIWY